MNPEPENFEALKQLLKIKRYEQPPPGYFDQLPRKIWARIETEQARAPFWQRFFPAIRLEPAVAYAFALIACGTLIVGFGFALKSETNDFAQPPAGEWNLNEMHPAFAHGNSILLSSNSATAASSTNPIAEPMPPFFGAPQFQVQPASFQR